MRNALKFSIHLQRNKGTRYALQFVFFLAKLPIALQFHPTFILLNIPLEETGEHMEEDGGFQSNWKL